MKLGEALRNTDIGVARKFLGYSERLEAIHKRLNEIEDELAVTCLKVPKMLLNDIAEEEGFLHEDIEYACFHINMEINGVQSFCGEDGWDKTIESDVKNVRDRQDRIKKLQSSLHTVYKVCRENNAKICKEAYELRKERGYIRMNLGI